MVRSQWLGAVVTGLAWTGLLWSQSPASPSAAPNLAVGATITVNETGKQPEQCQVQASWTEPNGTHVLQVRSVSSGETITVVSLAQPGVFRVYHWGQSSTAPAGVPTPPAAAAPRATAPAPAAPAALAGTLPQAVPVTPVAVPAQPASGAARSSSGVTPVSTTPMPGGNVVPASSPASALPTSQATAALPILPQPRDIAGAVATPAINPAPNNPTIALPAINTRSPQQPPPAQLSGNGAATPSAPPALNLGQTVPVAPALNMGPVSSQTPAPVGAPGGAGCASTATAPAGACAACAGSCCPVCCGKPSLWSRMVGKSSCCAKCPQTSCAAPSCVACPSCPCGKPSLWSRMFSKSSCCPACPAQPCPACTAQAATAATPAASMPAVPPPMPAVSQTPTSPPQVSDYRQSWGKIEQSASRPSVQTTTAAKPNETNTSTPAPDHLAPVAPAANPLEASPAGAVPAPAAPPKRKLFSRLRGNKPAGMENAIPLEQVQAPVSAATGTPAPEGAATGVPMVQANTPMEMMPAPSGPTTSRRPLFSRPRFGGRQPMVQNGIPCEPAAPAAPAGEGQPVLHTVDGQMPVAGAAMPPAESHERRGLFRGRRQPAEGTGSEEASGMARRGGLMPRGPFAMRPIEIDADAPNAFSPRQKEEKKDPREEERYANAFPMPPKRMGQNVNMGLPPLRLPQPPMQIPQAPFTSGQSRAQMPMQPDAGIPSGMANAFTPSWTGRPLPADLDNRPELANGFGNGENMNSMPPAPQAAQMAGANAFPGGNGGMMASAPRQPGYLPPADGGRQSVSAGYPPAAAPSSALQTATYRSTMAHMSLPASANLPAQALSTPQMLIMLRESLYPSQREWAAEQLSHLDWHREQVVVASLVQGAREDPAPAVRAACVHALGTMKVNTLPVVQTVQHLQKDRDLRVRQEAAETLTALGATAPSKSDGSVQRVGGTLSAE